MHLNLNTMLLHMIEVISVLFRNKKDYSYI